MDGKEDLVDVTAVLDHIVSAIQPGAVGNESITMLIIPRMGDNREELRWAGGSTLRVISSCVRVFFACKMLVDKLYHCFIVMRSKRLTKVYFVSFVHSRVTTSMNLGFAKTSIQARSISYANILGFQLDMVLKSVTTEYLFLELC
jgi:hypothetical protein